MKRLALGLLGGLAMVGCAVADPTEFHAGIARLQVQDEPSFEMFVWYPTRDEEVAWRAGEVNIEATRNAAVAAGSFPVVLFSHGSGGSPFGHRELLAHLARDGFIVVAPTQIGDSVGHTEGREVGRSLTDRPRQAVEALDVALADPRFAAHADAARIGMVGFSAGGYTTLVLVGAKPDFARTWRYCHDHAEDRGSCGNGVQGDEPAARLQELAAWQAPHEARIKAIVLMDPLAMPFGPADLSAVRVPTLLFRPASDDYLRAPANAAAVAAELPQPPRQITVPGSHFVFLDPCPPERVERLAVFCKDAPGVDRVVIHRELEKQISEFLRRNL